VSECPETGYTCHIISERDRLKALVLLGVARELWPPRAQAAWERYKGGPR